MKLTAVVFCLVGIVAGISVHKNTNQAGFSIPLRHKWNGHPELASRFVKKIHRHHQKLLGLLQADAIKGKTKKVHGNIELANENSFFAGEISMGSPEQKFHVVLDTGSDYLIVPSVYCETELCLKANRFDPANSSTYVSQTPAKLKKKGSYRSVYVKFGSGGVLAVLGKDTMHFGEVSIPDMRFGQIIKDDIDVGEVSNLEGILGLSSLVKKQPPIDINKEDEEEDNDPKVDKSGLSVVSTISRVKSLEQNLFSFYFSRRPENNGKFVLGGIPKEYQKGDIHWIPVVGEELYWSIPIDDIKVDGKSMNYCGGTGSKQCTAIVDTGTTLIVGPEAFSVQMLKALGVDPTCMDIGSLPKISFVLGGKDYELDAADYLVADSAARLRIEGVKTDIGNILMPTLEEEIQCAPGVVSGAGMYQESSDFGNFFSKYYMNKNQKKSAQMQFKDARAADDARADNILKTQSFHAKQKHKNHRKFKVSPTALQADDGEDKGPLDPDLSFILGNVFLRRYLSVYDVDNRRVGFAEAAHPANDAPIDIKAEVEDLNQQLHQQQTTTEAPKI